MSFGELGLNMNVKPPRADFKKVRNTFQPGVLYRPKRNMAVGASGALNTRVQKRP